MKRTMTHRNGARDTVVNTAAEDEGTVETERPRVARRGRSATPCMASLWDENRRLYMDNLRLWDCLTLVRGDPTMTCVNAIKLVFSLNDDDYLRMFPDTKQLMLLMFPGGIIYHMSSEEAKIENARLKDENARLHAAVWVLRDNPSLQADSTVAAIFRLDEAQFLSKFHSDAATYDIAPANTSNKLQYQNNNKERKKYFRTSLDLGNEPTMAIHLTNRPIKVGCVEGDKTYTKASKRQRSQSLVPTRNPSRHGSVSLLQHQDYTSNWKPTTPLGHEPIADKIKTSSVSHMDSDCAILCWRQNCYYRPVDLYALDVAHPCAEDIHCNHFRDYSQAHGSIEKSVKIRELRRSNTITRGGNVLEERISKRPSHAAPIKCVSFAEPLPSYRTDQPLKSEFVRDKDKVILDADCSNPYSALSNDEHSRIHCPAEVCDLVKKGESSSGLTNNNDLTKNVDSNPGLTKDAISSARLTKNANITKTSHKSGNSPDVYTVAATREPSKRCQRDTATSPVLDTRTCFLILGQSNLSSFPEKGVISKCDCTTSISDDYILNKSNNNDSNTTTVTSLTFTKPAISMSSAKSLYVRPSSPKRRDLLQARKKNLISFERISNSVAFQHKGNKRVQCSTNNAIGNILRRSTFSLINKLHNINTSSQAERTERDDKEEDEDDYEEEKDLQRNSDTNVRNSIDVKPKIYFSDTPAPMQKKMHLPYSLTSYPTVRHFLERHNRILLQGSPCSPSEKEDFTWKKYPSMALLSIESDKALTMKHEENVEANGSTLEKQSSISSGQRAESYIAESDHKYTVKIIKSDVSEGMSASGKAKEHTDVPAYSTTYKLKELNKLGNFKYSKPLAAMLSRNGCYHWTAHKKGTLSTGPSLASQKFSQAQGSRIGLKPLGPFITFIPRAHSRRTSLSDNDP